MSRIFSRLVSARVLAGGATIGAATYATKSYLITPLDEELTVQFNKPYGYYNPTTRTEVVVVPADWKGRRFELSNEYPVDIPSPVSAGTIGNRELPPAPGPDLPLPVFDPHREFPWLDIDFTKEPGRYCDVIKQYCWEGFVGNPNNSDIKKRDENNYNPFLPKINNNRAWYHVRVPVRPLQCNLFSFILLDRP
jgi:hypothetical protein